MVNSEGACKVSMCVKINPQNLLI